MVLTRFLFQSHTVYRAKLPLSHHCVGVLIVYLFVRCEGWWNGVSSWTIDLGDREEEQLFLGEAVREGQRKRPVQQGDQQSIQSQFVQALWYLRFLYKYTHWRKKNDYLSFRSLSFICRKSTFHIRLQIKFNWEMYRRRPRKNMMCRLRFIVLLGGFFFFLYLKCEFKFKPGWDSKHVIRFLPSVGLYMVE